MKRKEGKRATRKRWIVEVDVRAVTALAITVVMAVLCLLCLFLYARTFIGIQKFEMVGVSRYDERDIINASLLKRGDRLYTLDLDAVEEQILSECPYLESVEVSTRFPSTIRFTVEERIPQWYIELSGEFYVLDENLVMMTDHASDERLKKEGVTKLALPNLTRVMRGELPQFGIVNGERDETEIRKTLELIAAVRRTPFKERISELDLSNRFAITMTVDGSYHVNLGDASSFEAKLREVEIVLNSEELKAYASGTIDASLYPNQPTYFKRPSNP